MFYILLPYLPIRHIFYAIHFLFFLISQRNVQFNFFIFIYQASPLFKLYFIFYIFSFQIQNFRFLCPNATAFDQEAQTCADFGDVDCEQATLYYGSDNFDLYRIGSGFEHSKHPTPATEDESTFHLQRAESSKLHLVRFKRFQCTLKRCISVHCAIAHPI